MLINFFTGDGKINAAVVHGGGMAVIITYQFKILVDSPGPARAY